MSPSRPPAAPLSSPARPVRLAALVALALWGPAPLAAQVAGRWALTLTAGSGPENRAELRLSQSGPSLEGSFLLDERDTSWARVTGQVDSDGAGFHIRVDGDAPVELTGRASSGGLDGAATIGGRRGFRWHAVRLAATDEFYPSAPRFLLRQMVIGDGAPTFRIPGAWLGAAADAGETVDAMFTRYGALASRAGLPPLAGDSLSGEILLRAMGLLDRTGFRENVRRTLEAIRGGLQNDTLRARFDFLFRRNGDWVVDLHDAALVRARRPFPTLSWAAAIPALRSVGLLGDTVTATESIMLGVYRMFARAAIDSAGFADLSERMQTRDPASGRAVLQLIEGYRQAGSWYEEVMRFFLVEPWVDAPGGARSVADLVRAFWGDSLPLPAVVAHAYGYPEGAARSSVDSSLVSGLIVPRNAPAQDWLKRHGHGGLLQVMDRLDGGFGGNTSLGASGESIRLSSLGEYRRSAFNGFLEPHDLILIDPSYEPLLALGTLVHEWQHIIQEHRRGSLAFRSEGRQVTYGFLDPYLAEGLAEWASEAILAPASRRFPLVALGEAEKRVSLAPDNPHVLGYLLVRTLAVAVNRPPDLLAMLAEQGTDPAAVARLPALRRRWSRFAAPDRVVPRRSAPVLLPETEFAVEDMVPDVVARRILVGP